MLLAATRPPAGITTRLIKKPDGTYQLQERFGTVLTFNCDNKLHSLTDLDSKLKTTPDQWDQWGRLD